MIALAVALLAAAVPSAHGFGFNQPKRATSAKSAASSSPRLDDALSSYPFVVKDEDRPALTATFNELARLYGDDEALQMVKVTPRVFKFDRDNFEPCLDSWTEQFGPDAVRGMVSRNPGLLGLPAWQTENAESSFALSYVIAATRPGPFSLAALAAFALYFAGNEDFWTGGGFYNGELVEGR